MIRVITSRDMQENCYLIIKNQECVLIDPGEDADLMIDLFTEHNLYIKAILLTHGHFDHIVGVDGLVNHYHCPVYAHQLTSSFVKNERYSIAAPLESEIIPIHSSVDIDAMHFDYYYTPGHTCDSGIYYYKEEEALFTGDTLFAGSIGRTDLPTGDQETMFKSLKVIAALPFDAIIYPGHGPSTKLSEEIRSNMYIQYALRNF